MIDANADHNEGKVLRLDYSIYDHVDVPVFVLVPDAEGRPVYDFLNRAGRDRLGKTLSGIIGKAAFDVFEGRAAYSVYRKQLQAWQAGCSTSYEIALPLKDHHVWFRTDLIATHDAQGNLERMIGTSNDISAERALEQQDAITAASLREMEDFVCLAAHDLRSPIGNLKSLAYLMRRNFVDHGDGKVELIDMLDVLSDKCLDVISETMARVMAKSAPTVVDSFDLGEVCDDILVLLDPMRTHAVEYPRLPLEADIVSVQIILRNLIDNAIKHADGAAVQVFVTVTQVNPQRLRLSVRDTGTGFQEGQMPTSPNATLKSGFGLHGVRRLVKARGGTVAVSTPGDGIGAEVTVELPGRVLDDSQCLPRTG